MEFLDEQSKRHSASWCGGALGWFGVDLEWGTGAELFLLALVSPYTPGETAVLRFVCLVPEV